MHIDGLQNKIHTKEAAAATPAVSEAGEKDSIDKITSQTHTRREMPGQVKRENKAAELSWEVKGHTGSRAGNESRAGNSGQAQVQMGQQVDAQAVK